VVGTEHAFRKKKTDWLQTDVTVLTGGCSTDCCWARNPPLKSPDPPDVEPALSEDVLRADALKCNDKRDRSQMLHHQDRQKISRDTETYESWGTMRIPGADDESFDAFAADNGPAAAAAHRARVPFML